MKRTYRVKATWTRGNRFAFVDIDAETAEAAEREALGYNGTWELDGGNVAIMPPPDDASVVTPL